MSDESAGANLTLGEDVSESEGAIAGGHKIATRETLRGARDG
jgi:hypothetical protein